MKRSKQRRLAERRDANIRTYRALNPEKTYDEIAGQFGCSRQTVCNALKAAESLDSMAHRAKE